MLAVIYRSKIISGKEELYIECWREISAFLKNNKGALGSCIHQDVQSGLWVIYSRWPDLETKEKSWPLDGKEDLPEGILRISDLMLSCVEEIYEPQFLELIEDALL